MKMRYIVNVVPKNVSKHPTVPHCLVKVGSNRSQAYLDRFRKPVGHWKGEMPESRFPAGLYILDNYTAPPPPSPQEDDPILQELKRLRGRSIVKEVRFCANIVIPIHYTLCIITCAVTQCPLRRY
ncbi:hypothetical protein CEXT_233201 [Caerostris extrusa]|uniref:Uncharacterized protein n=1 Tax=Caerostris extrusa TaxID=172846 RepID=A0AAV4XV61_CAEEX|nr:hypothetical protein CEXT_233201 [Caerostris extrusa]